MFGTGDRVRVRLKGFPTWRRCGRLDLEALEMRRIGVDDVESAFKDVAAGHGQQRGALRRGGMKVPCYGHCPTVALVPR
jgi:hypothetical protein